MKRLRDWLSYNWPGLVILAFLALALTLVVFALLMAIRASDFHARRRESAAACPGIAIRDVQGQVRCLDASIEVAK